MKTSSKISRQTKETNQRKVDNNRIPKAIDSAPTNKTAKRKRSRGGGEERGGGGGGEVRRSFDNGHKSVDRFLLLFPSTLANSGLLPIMSSTRARNTFQSGMLLEILPPGANGAKIKPRQ